MLDDHKSAACGSRNAQRRPVKAVLLDQPRPKLRGREAPAPAGQPSAFRLPASLRAAAPAAIALQLQAAARAHALAARVMLARLLSAVYTDIHVTLNLPRIET